ncbi:uncharacterized protein M438DRAFT_347367 [Lecanosticta acicola]|uniref:Uncharacterized protein M438DRAFT_347367 n=1 Tax=Lecanosticta acicola TaxID=111012 RepID=A0AAI8YV58_9PEZI|nr:uncharacterized protein M438DRAFT_347367 [Lecanosticta acicola]
MASIYQPRPDVSFVALRTHLQSLPTPLLAPRKVCDPSLSDKIASLYLHPALEALLHLLNHDLPSAHFLVRHMQSPPAYEGMYLHGILHRIEGDMDNARAWYCDVAESEPFELIWTKATEEERQSVQGSEKKLPAQKTARDFLDRIESLAQSKHGDRGPLVEESRRELESLLRWCVDRFGTESCVDATQVWVQPSQEISEKGARMVTGSEGFRMF